MRVINQSQRYKLRPSEILNIDDDYTAFCLDEACMFIISMLEETDKDDKQVNRPKWAEEETEEVTNNDSLIEALKGLT